MRLRTTSFTALLALLATLLLSPRAAAQASPSHSLRTGWLAVNLGRSLAGPGSNPLSVLAVDLQFQRNHAWFGLRAAGMLYAWESSESVGELALLYGRATRRTSSQAAIGAGLSVIEVCEFGCRTTIGVALAARGAVRPLPVLGLGLQFMGNLNSANAVAAFTLFLEIGKLR